MTEKQKNNRREVENDNKRNVIPVKTGIQSPEFRVLKSGFRVKQGMTERIGRNDRIDDTASDFFIVIPADAGIQTLESRILKSRFRVK